MRLLIFQKYEILNLKQERTGEDGKNARNVETLKYTHFHQFGLNSSVVMIFRDDEPV